jgi:uncharacterized membrane protein SpoIIM required for sporulation
MKNEYNIIFNIILFLVYIYTSILFYIRKMIKSIADNGATTYRRTTIDGVFASEINLRYIKISLNNMLHDGVTILHS